MKHKSLSPVAALLCMLLTAMIWGFAFSAQKEAGDAIGSLSVTCLRSAIAAAALFFLILIFDRVRGDGRRLLSRRGVDITRTEWLGGVLCGLALATATLLQQYGMQENGSAGKTAFITALYVALVPLFGIFLGKKTAPLVLCGVVGSVLGAFVLSFDLSGGASFSFARGDLLCFLSAVMFAVHILMIDRFSPHTDGIRVSFVQFLTGAVLTLPLMLLFERGTVTADAMGRALLPLLYLGVMSSGVAYTLQIVGQSRVHPVVASTLLCTESIFGLLGGMLFFGETLSAREWVGCALLFVSVLLSQTGSFFHRPQPPKQEKEADL